MYRNLIFAKKNHEKCNNPLHDSWFSLDYVGVKRYFDPYDAYELLRCKAAPAILQTFEIR